MEALSDRLRERERELTAMKEKKRKADEELHVTEQEKE